MDGAKDLERLFGVRNRGSHQGGFVGSRGTARVARAGVPGARDDALISGDFGVLDVNPVTERPAWRFVEAGTCAVIRPRARVPLAVVVDSELAASHVDRELIHPVPDLVDEDLRFDTACGNSAERGE